MPKPGFPPRRSALAGLLLLGLAAAAPAPSGDGPYAAAVSALSAGDLARAREGFEAAIAADPKQEAPYLGLAAAAVVRNDFAGAEAALRRGVAALPASADMHVALGRILARQNRPADAEAEFRLALAQDNASISARLSLGDLYAALPGRAEEALRLYDAAAAADVSDAGGRLGRGRVLTSLGRTTEAEAALAEAARLAPNLQAVAIAQADLALRNRQPDAALAAYDRAVAMPGNPAAARVGKGEVLRAQGRLTEAAAEYRAARDSDAKLPGAPLGLALIHQATPGETAEAEREYANTLALDPNNVVALNNLAWLLAARKADLDKAVEWATRATALSGYRPDVMDTLGWALRQRGEPARAAAVLEAGLTRGRLAILYRHLGIVRTDLGAKAEAASAFRAALEIDPNDAEARAGLAQLAQP